MNAEDIPLNRLYDDLAWLWPVFSPPEEYAEEAAHWRTVLREALGPGRHPVLELGVGGGHNLSHLAPDFEVVAVDLSARMLENSRRLNPGVEHRLGDMRTLRLGRTFRAVLIHDAVSHLLSEAELAATFATAAAHLDPGGLFVCSPDAFRETFRPPTLEHTLHSGAGIELATFEFAHDPDPADTRIETLFTHIIRRGVERRIELDRMVTGLFTKAAWARGIEAAGFDFAERAFRLEGMEQPYVLLTGRRR